MMTPLMIVALLTAVVSVMGAPYWDNPMTNDGTAVSSNEVKLNEVGFEEQSKRHTKKINNAKDELDTVNSHEFNVGQKISKLPKKTRKHKNFYFNYPYISNLNKYTPVDDYDDLIQEKSIGYGKKQQESNIFYVRLPPTPYYFVPGLGYISNPPTFSTSSIRPQPIKNVKPNHSQHTNAFINLPIDFVSNGKPTSVYQWENNNRKTSKRPDTSLNKLKKGPYGFNGRPTSLYLLTSDGQATMHQPIRYNNIRGNNIY